MQLCRNNLADSLSRQGKYDEAEKMQREVLAVKQRVLGAEHPDTLTTADNLAQSLSGQRKYDEAETMHPMLRWGISKRLLHRELPSCCTESMSRWGISCCLLLSHHLLEKEH